MKIKNVKGVPYISQKEVLIEVNKLFNMHHITFLRYRRKGLFTAKFIHEDAINRDMPYYRLKDLPKIIEAIKKEKGIYI